MNTVKTPADRPLHVLIVDDDREIRDLLESYLSQHGFRVTGVADGAQMWASFDANIDFVVLDVMLPGDDGLKLCRALRKKSEVPVIMLTARSHESDRIMGLEIGADDYLSKPFSPRELLARIRVILKRTRSGVARPQGPVRFMHFADWTLDLVARHLIDPAGIIVPLSGGEYKLLMIFLGNPDHVLDRSQLMEIMRGREADPADRSIDLMVSRLRQRLNEHVRNFGIIKTVRGEGYVLAVPVRAGD